MCLAIEIQKYKLYSTHANEGPQCPYVHTYANPNICPLYGWNLVEDGDNLRSSRKFSGQNLIEGSQTLDSININAYLT